MKDQKPATETLVPCRSCRLVNVFQQPYQYHAGFGNQGFLYNDAGTLTLVWSSFDPAYEAIVGHRHPWALTAELQHELEARLLPAPVGGSWRFSNPPRCRFCGHAIGEPIGTNIYYLFYDESIDANSTLGAAHGLEQYLQPATHAA